jgi:hypothetical protein
MLPREIVTGPDEERQRRRSRAGYTKPTLSLLGTVKEITRSGGGPGDDDDFGGPSV